MLSTEPQGLPRGQRGAGIPWLLSALACGAGSGPCPGYEQVHVQVKNDDKTSLFLWVWSHFKFEGLRALCTPGSKHPRVSWENQWGGRQGQKWAQETQHVTGGSLEEIPELQLRPRPETHGLGGDTHLLWTGAGCLGPRPWLSPLA